eukprot:Hpha_TRINITY_DN34048_c0_g1::TRINITY_DN34048_c0_g1_i1::g.30433::m.30433
MELIVRPCLATPVRRFVNPLQRQRRWYDPKEIHRHPRWLARLDKPREDKFKTLPPPPKLPRSPENPPRPPEKKKEVWEVSSPYGPQGGGGGAKIKNLPPAAPSQAQQQTRFGGLVTFLSAGGARPSPAKESAPREADPIAEFDLRPREVRDHLDRFVVGQDDAKRVLSIAVCDHYRHARACMESPEIANQAWTKPNVLLVGPTGVGKTHLLRVLTRLVGVPMVVADATKFSATGYVGGDAEDCIRSLVAAAGGNAARAQYGVVYLDEVDKIAVPRGPALSSGSGVNTKDVQNALLKLMEDTDVSVSKGDTKARVSTRHILFIASGAFNALRAGSTQGEAAESVPTQALVEVGLEPEFVGRLPVRVALHSLSEDHILELLTRVEGSVLRQTKAQFERYGISVHWREDALRMIAGEAAMEGTGARGLVTIVERVLSPFKFALPCTPIRHLEVTPAVVADPRAALSDIVADVGHSQQEQLLLADVGRFQAEFRRRSGGREVVLDDEASAAVVLLAKNTGKTVHHILWTGGGERLLRRISAEAQEEGKSLEGAEPLRIVAGDIAAVS